MAISPILISGLELLEHSIKHLRAGSNKDLKLAVLHADNAVELILKEIARYYGIRIIDKKGQSIGYYDCISKLQSKAVVIPELPDIDLLHTERNSIYHIGSQPDNVKAEWLVFAVALTFIKRICQSEFAYDINTFSLTFDKLALTNSELVDERTSIVQKYLSEAVWTHENYQFNVSIIASYSGIEAYLGNAIPIDVRSDPTMIQKIVDDDLISKEDMADFLKIREIKDKIAYGISNGTSEESELALKTFKSILYSVDSMLQ